MATSQGMEVISTGLKSQAMYSPQKPLEETQSSQYLGFIFLTSRHIRWICVDLSHYCGNLLQQKLETNMCPDKIALWGCVLFQCEVESVFNIMYQKANVLFILKSLLIY